MADIHIRNVAAWTFLDVPRLLDDLEHVASNLGYLLSAYGSTMRRGKGRDLDLILSQKRMACMPAEFALKAIASHLKAEIVAPPERSMFADSCALLQLPDGRLLDIQVRMSSNRMDALDLYESGFKRSTNH